MRNTSVMKTSSFIVITDLRITMIMAALKIARSAAMTGRTQMLISSRITNARDYGDFQPPFLKRLKLFVLRFFFGCIIIPRSDETIVDPVFNLGIKSSLASITYDSLADEDGYPKIYSDLVDLTKGAIELTNFIKKTARSKISEVYIFNGRLASSYPIKQQLDKESDISLYYYEFANNNQGYVVYPFSIHDDYSVGLSLINYSCNSFVSKPISHTRAENFKYNKTNNFLTKFYTSSLDTNFDVVVFLGSDHEYVFVSSSETGAVSIGNLELVKQVIANYKPTHSIAVRSHPNQRVDKNYQTSNSPIAKLCREHGVMFYDPISDVSSYELIKNAKVVAIDISSIGLDAIFLGKTVHVFGNSSLKAIIDSMPPHIKENNILAADYVAQVMAFSADLFVKKFSLAEFFALALLARLEQVFYYWYALDK
jgi:hypothetical protein